MKNTLKLLIDTAIRWVVTGKPDLLYTEKINVLPAQPDFNYTPFHNLNKLPKIIQEQFAAIIQKDGFLHEQTVHLYSNVYISNEGVIFKNFRVSLTSITFAGRRTDYYNSFFLKQWLNAKVQCVPTVIAVVYNSNSYNNYYHWIVEACSKLMVLSNYNRDCAVLVPAPVPEYVIVTTNMLGFSNLVPITEREILKANKVIEVAQTSEVGNTNINDYATHQDPLLIRQVRERILSQLSIPEQKPNKLLFISRAKQRARRLQNETAAMQVLAEFGFELVFLEGLKFEEQIKLLHQAKIIIGVHGANLTNSLFMKPNQVVIELIYKNYFNPTYYRLAAYSGLHYSRIGCEAVDKEQGPEWSDIIVDIDELKATVLKMLKE